MVTQADQIRRFVIDRYLSPSFSRGVDEVVVRAGDVHREMSLSSAMPAVCSAIGGDKFLALAGVELVERRRPTNGANVYFHFRKRTGSPALDRASVTKLAPDLPAKPRREIDLDGALVLVSCVKSKRPHAAAARELYVSSWFTKVRAIVEAADVRKRDAEARQRELLAQAAAGEYVDERTVPTVAEAVHHWLADRDGKVKATTLTGYKVVCAVIRGPLLVGSRRERAEFTRTGKKPKGATFLKMLGKVKLNELSTADIRGWHRVVVEQTGTYTAHRAKAHLKSILALAEEDFRVRAPSLPTGLSRARHKPKKAILTGALIRQIIAAARSDEYGVYYAFPFLAGTRPSEQLGLLWDEVDFDKNVIRVRRIQERDGSLTEMTKTEAGTREIPMGSTLCELLLAWRVRCPRKGKELHRVFPGPGRLQAWPRPRLSGGGPLLYQNFRRRYWEDAFKRLGLPYVTPHSARHSFISTLQAQGIEVGLVAQIAGHANPTVTLGHYTQAVRGGAAAITALEQAYG